MKQTKNNKKQICNTSLFDPKNNQPILYKNNNYFLFFTYTNKLTVISNKLKGSPKRNIDIFYKER